MKSISILGCGWLGMPLGAELVKLGYSVNGSTRKESKLQEIIHLGMKPHLLDLSQPNDNVGFFESDILIIAIPPSSSSSPEEFYSQLSWISKVYSTGYVLFVSSTGVYPNLNRVVTEEDASVEALSRSGISLLKAEGVVKSSKTTVIRFGGLIDSRRHPGKWFAGKSGISGGSVPVNLVHLDDCIGSIIKIIDLGAWGRTYNVCHSDHPLKTEYYPKMSEGIGLEPPQFNPHLEDWKIVSSDKFIHETGYGFQKSIWQV